MTHGQGDIVEHDVEPRGSPHQVVSHQSTNVLSLRNELAGVKLRHNALQNLIDDRRQDAFIVVCAEGAIDLRECIDTRPRQHTTGDVHHLQVLCACEGGNISGLRAHVVSYRGLEPGDPNMRP